MQLKELAIGQQFKLGDELYEKIEPIKKSCCKRYTAKKLSDDTNVIIKEHTEVELVEEE